MVVALDTSRILMTVGLTTAPGKPSVAPSARAAAPALDTARLISTKGLTVAAGKPA